MTTMDYTKTLQALRKLKVQTGSLACLGCGHEHNCSTHGCAILRNAVEHMEADQANHDRLEALLRNAVEHMQVSRANLIHMDVLLDEIYKATRG